MEHLLEVIRGTEHCREQLIIDSSMDGAMEAKTL